ncbi:Triose-phosphate Transporter [Actinomortierella wolfii]|nr:Triose-phosphate Transporter [Actinomortierella wolfii]
MPPHSRENRLSRRISQPPAPQKGHTPVSAVSPLPPQLVIPSSSVDAPSLPSDHASDSSAATLGALNSIKSSTGNAVHTSTPHAATTSSYFLQDNSLAKKVDDGDQAFYLRHQSPSISTTSSVLNGPRTQLGSILASTFGFNRSSPSSVTPSPTTMTRPPSLPSSPSSYSPMPPRYTAVPTSPRAASASSQQQLPLFSSSPSIANGGGSGTTTLVGTPTSGRKPSNLIMNAFSFSKNASNAGYYPLQNTQLGAAGPASATATGSGSSSVYINIHGSSSSMPQIVMPKKKVVQNIMSNMSYIAAWYFFSTALSIYNKNLMGKDNWNFNLPLFVSSIHTGLHFVITACLMHFWPNTFDATQSGKGGRITMHSYVTKVVPCAVAAALEICMANASLMYITLSFYTMIKSSTPIWVLLFAFLFRLEKPRPSLILIIFVIVIGVVLTVAGETQFDPTGFILVLMAAVMSGLRWSLTQMLLQKDDLGMDNPIATLYYISPIMFMLMSVLSLVIEDPFVVFASSEFFSSFRTGFTTLMLAAGGGLLAFAMTIAEFKLIKNTGTVTLSVAGISKEIFVISLSVMIFGDQLTPVNLLGYVPFCFVSMLTGTGAQKMT